MQLPALSIKPPDISGSVRTLMAMKAAGRKARGRQLTGNALFDMMGRRGGGNARSGAPGDDALAGGASGNAMLGLGGEAAPAQGAAGTAGDLPPSVIRLMQHDPERGMKVLNLVENHYAKADEREREALQRRNEAMGRRAITVIDAPKDRKEGAYAQMLQMAPREGLDVSELPPQWGPQAAARLQMALREAMSFGDLVKMRETKDPSIIEIYDKTSGRKRKGYMQDGKFVPVGGEAAQTAGAGGEGPARVREAQWLVQNKIFPDIKAAYNATRTRVAMDQTTKRTKALTWVEAQKDRNGRNKYSTPEEQNAALNAYLKWVEGDSQGALAALKALEPKKDADEFGMIKSLYRSAMPEFMGGDPGEEGGAALSGTETAAGQAPQGQGTPESPYKATTQEDIDWFKKNTPEGSVIEANGKTYIK